MVGSKVDIKSFGKTRLGGHLTDLSHDEVLLSHYTSLSAKAKKTAKAFFKENFKSLNGFQSLTLDDAIQQFLFEVKGEVPFPGPEKGSEVFTFIDLFAGIGGFRMALQNLGGRCVFSSEWDKYSRQTYRANYGDIPFGDITLPETRSCIPKKFDVLCGGFPCQPFSLAGVSKKISLGRKHGFDDIKQGNLFFHVADIIANHRPKAFFLENVKNLVSHDKGKTFQIIKETLEALGYSFDKKILDAKHFVPQHRERTLMVGFDKKVFGNDVSFNFSEVALPDASHSVKNILQKKVDAKYTLSAHLWNYLQEYARKHKAKGNGFGFGLVNLEGITRTMSARYHKDGSEILIPQKNAIPRRLTPREAAALFGYPDSFVIPGTVSDTQAYRQFGNSVVVPLIQAIAHKLIPTVTSGLR